VADLLLRDRESLLAGNIVLGEDRRSSTLRTEVVRDALYGECPEEDVSFALARLQPEPTAPSRTPLNVTDERFGSIPRSYVECLRDKAVSNALQKAMQAEMPCAETATMDTDHSPFFSQPEMLATILSGFAR
jgi:hypothetical protein